MALGISRAQQPAANHVAIPTADGQAVSGACTLLGVSLGDTSGGALRGHLYNGTDATGTAVACIHVASNGGTTLWFGPGGISCDDGIYLKKVAGTITKGAIMYHDA